jgi:hypothetical protein
VTEGRGSRSAEAEGSRLNAEAKKGVDRCFSMCYVICNIANAAYRKERVE